MCGFHGFARAAPRVACPAQRGVEAVTSLVLATLQQSVSGVSVLAAVPNVAGRSFTLHLSKSVAASAKVAWFVVN